MSKRITAVSHEDELSLVDHLDELRGRLISVIIVFVVALVVAFWQNAAILKFVNAPLPNGTVPSTFGVSEAFVATLTVASYAALIVTLPVLIYQIYAFVIPALSPDERRVALPLLLMAPVLFVAGVAFGYVLVLPAATHFLLNFNNDQFNVQVRAREYYSFFAITLLSVGLLFQLPIGILIATRIGLVSPQQLRDNRRYALLVIAIIAMLLPGTDPITMLISMVPLLILYEGSVQLVSLLERRDRRKAKKNSGEKANLARQ
ncbi:MAG: twin-arginine translocase subunit TatC [Thermoleophilaceae bacterium]|nr:twin-arginine translocase subunit TatC [Thermoleophilaceae bacterium]